MPKIIAPAELARRLAAGEDLAAIAADKAVRLVDTSGSAAVTEGDAARTVRFAISTTGVKRDGMSLTGQGWKIDAYLNNPVVLWSHDDMTPAIGRSIETAIVNGTLMSSAVFAERDVHPLADTVYELIKRGFLNAASVGFIPLKARVSKDPERAGEIDILEQELWEWSVVNVPADPDALVAARSAGVDTQPIFQWTERMLDAGGFLIVPKAELEALRRNAKMPAAAKATKATKTAPTPVRRSLWHVSSLADLLQSLAYLQTNVAYEAAYEEDGSTVPAALLTAIKGLGQALVDMTDEEVGELLANLGPEDDASTAPAALKSPTPAQRAVILINQALRGAKAATAAAPQPRFVIRTQKPLSAHAATAVRQAFADWQAGKGALLLDDGITLEAFDATGKRSTPLPVEIRAGRVLSADNEQCLRDAHDLLSQAADKVMGIVKLNAAADDTGDTGTADDGAATRRARAVALKTPPAT
jgi:HK97 family phage prohead protease